MTQQANSVTDNSTTAHQLLNSQSPAPYVTTTDPQLNSHSPAPYVEVEGGSVPHSEYLSYNSPWNFSVTEPNSGYFIQQTLTALIDDDDPEPKFELRPEQIEDRNSNWESSMSSLGDGEGDTNANEQFNFHDNSQRDAENEVQCFEPNPSRLDQADQASNGRIQKGGKPAQTPVEKAKSKLDQAGTSAEADIGKKRKGREPINLTKEQKDERTNKKREKDRKYRGDRTTELQKLRTMEPLYETLKERVSRFGGIDQMESELLRLRQKDVDYGMFQEIIETKFPRPKPMSSKYGGIEEMESMLDRFKEMEVESHRFKLMKSKHGEIEELEAMLDKFKGMEAELAKLNQMKSKLGIQEIESIVEKFKEMEAKLRTEKHQQMLKQMAAESFPASPGSRQQMEMDEWYRQQPKAPDFDRNHTQEELPVFREPPGSHQCGISHNSSAAVSGTTPDMQNYSEEDMDQFIATLTDDNFVRERVASHLDDSFKDSLDGECESVGRFKIPLSLVSTARVILKVRGDISKKSKYSAHLAQNIFVWFCAAIKEMGDRSLEEVTEDTMWEWRDTIMDAIHNGFDVEFAMKHLETIVRGYFGLKAHKDRDSLEQRMISLRALQETLKKELGKTTSEINAVEAKQRDLTSEKCKICLESADKFSGIMLEDYEISEMFHAAECGTMPNLVYSDALVIEFIDDDVMSLYGFNDLHGECQTVEEFTFPWSLLSNVNDILP